MNKTRHGIVLFVLLLTGGCAVTPPAAISPAEWNTVKLQRQTLAKWSLTGRAAVAIGEEGWTAGLEWRQDNDRFELKLSGTFGVGGVRASGDGQSLEIETSKGEKFSGGEALGALQRTLGVELPLRSLRFWLLGVPEPEVPAVVQLGDQGTLQQLTQASWRIAYDQYDASGMPGRIVLEKEGVRVRVVVDRWQL